MVGKSLHTVALLLEYCFVFSTGSYEQCQADGAVSMGRMLMLMFGMPLAF